MRFRRKAGMLMSPISSEPNSGRSNAAGCLRASCTCRASTCVLPPNPVAMTVILISPCMVSSRTTPKMMLADGSAAARTISAAFWTSWSVMSLPAVMLKRIPFAPSMDVSSSGLDTACLAASSARESPAPWPMPISASPAFSMIAFTSAKSRLMTPGWVTRSEMPCTPWRRTSSAIRNASSSVVFELATCASRSLGMTISASTWLRRALMPSSAVSLRTRPSNENGRVTTPIVSAPASFAACATIAADPVPVPPPMPAVMNTMSESLTTSDSSARLSSAASRPRVQSPPAPRPRVSLLPIWTLMSAWQRSSACLSVLTAMNWTLRAFEIMRFTALPPPPPQPTTLIRARPSCNSLSFMLMTRSSFSGCALAMASSSWLRWSSLEKISKPPHCFLIGRRQRHGLTSVGVHRVVMRSRAPLDQADRGRELRPLAAVGEPAQTGGLAEAHRRVEHRLGGVRRAHQARAAAADHDARGQQPVEAGLADLVARHAEDLLHARADDLGEEPARQRLDAVAAHLPDLDLLAVVDDVGQRVAVVELQLLGLVERRAQTDRDVARHVVAAHRQRGIVARGALVVDHDRGVAGADVDEAGAEVDLLRREHAFTRGEAGAHDVVDVEARAVHALHHVLDRGLRARDDVRLHLEALARHADRVAHALVAVDRVGARDDVHDLAIGGDADRARGFDDALHVVLAYLAVRPRNGDDAGRVLRPHVRAAE